MQEPFETLPYVIREFGLAPPPDVPGAPAGQHRAILVTIVVENLATAGPALATRLGCPGRAVEPAELPEAGLAQRFDLDGGRVLALEPADDTAAREYLLTHGEGIYAIAFGPGNVEPVATAAAPLNGGLGSVNRTTPRSSRGVG